MKNIVTSVLVLIVGFSGSSFALESGVDIEITSDFYSKYVWRGQVLTDDWVWQPGASFAAGGLSGGIWGNLNMTDESPGYDGEFTEVDYYIDYSSDLTDGIGFSVGYINYHFPQTAGDTYEFYGGLSFDTVLSPSVTWYYDADEVDGSYVAFGFGHSVEEVARLSEDTPVGMDIGLNIGWADSDYNNAYWSVADDGLNDLTLSFAFPVEIANWSITPSLNYMTLLDRSVRSSAGSNDNAFFAGISLSTAF